MRTFPDVVPSDYCPRWKHDKEGRQQALIEAATEVFAQHGFDAATTREVAERAGCSEGLIHRYFGGKRGLLLALLEDRAAKSAASMTAVEVENEPLLEVVTRMVSLQLRAMWESQAIMRVSVSRASIDPDVAAIISAQFNQVRVQQIRMLLDRLSQRGLIRAGIDLDSVAHAIAGLGFALGFWAQVVFQQDRASVEHNAREIAAVIARGLAPRSSQPTGNPS